MLKIKKKTIIPIIALLLGIAIPISALSVSQSRNLILGLAPEEAVLELADKIDDNRNDYLAQNEELEKTIKNQQKEIESLKSSLETQLKETTAVATVTQNQNYCLKANELFATIPKKPKHACSTAGPTNIVDMYKAIRDAYKRYKDDDETKSGDGDLARDCFKKYLDILEPAYNEYLEAKKLCN